jgi:hypothetical protein
MAASIASREAARALPISNRSSWAAALSSADEAVLSRLPA